MLYRIKKQTYKLINSKHSPKCLEFAAFKAWEKFWDSFSKINLI